VANPTALAASIATAAAANAVYIPGAANITAPTVAAVVTTTTVTGDSGRTAVVAVTAFTTAVIAMVM